MSNGYRDLMLYKVSLDSATPTLLVISNVSSIQQRLGELKSVGLRYKKFGKGAFGCFGRTSAMVTDMGLTAQPNLQEPFAQIFAWPIEIAATNS